MNNKKKDIAKLWLHIFGATILLAGVIVLFGLTNLDLTVQDRFYNFKMHSWLIDTKNPFLRLFFYTGPKALYICLGIICLWKFIFAPKSDWSLKNSCLKICLSLVLVPLIISGIKNVSDIYTPNQTIRYEGHYPHLKMFFKEYPSGFTPDKHGRGWPAGHASGGFSLMILYYCFSKRSCRIYGLLGGLLAGWITGLYQTLNGQHFISHSLVTMLMAWIIINLIELFIGQAENSC